jgi:histidinol-phosphate/aromatic aminotransferase/cobyric acid decarboxylase-like protein
MTDKPPREWFINLDHYEIWELEENAPKGSIHVIEHSAYATAMERIADLETSVNLLRHERDQLKAELERVKGVLKSHGLEY